MPDSRPNLRIPEYGNLTQGTVFSCAQAFQYEDCKIFGLAITARCDIAQGKYPVLNYLPIVRLEDWLRRDGLDILFDQEERSQSDTMKGMLKQANVSESLLLSIPLSNIADTHFPENTGNRGKNKSNNKFREHIKLVEEFSNIKETGDYEVSYNWFKSKQPNEITKLVRRLSRHDVLGHYFLETLSHEDGDAGGYVCLLRQVHTISRHIAEYLGKGLERSIHQDLCAREQHTSGLSIAPDELAMTWSNRLYNPVKR